MTKKKKAIIVLFAIIAVGIICSLTLWGIFLKDPNDGAQGGQYKVASATNHLNVSSFLMGTESLAIHGSNVQIVIDSPQAYYEFRKEYKLLYDYDEEIFETYGLYVYNREHGFYKKIRGYDDEFFNDKELIYIATTVCFPKVHAFETRTFKDVDLVDDELIVTLAKTVDKECGYGDDTITYIFVIELDKAVGNHPVVLNVVEEEEI